MHCSHYGSYMLGTKSNLPTGDVGRPPKMGKSVQSRRSPSWGEEAVSPYRRDLIAGLPPFTIDAVSPENESKDLICRSKPGAPSRADVLLAPCGVMNLKGTIGTHFTL
jgi:hypothetical protein